RQTLLTKSVMKKCRASCRIAIIGAGASGVAAATRLLENGFCHVQILEAEDYIGGRIRTIPFADNVADLGAQWCHGMKNNCVYDMVKHLDLVAPTGDFFNDVAMVRSNKEVVPLELGHKLQEMAYGSIPNDSTPAVGSMGSYVVEQFWKAVENQITDVDRELAAEFLESFQKHESSIEGSDNLFEISGRSHLEYEECEGDQLVHWRCKGYARFLRLLMKVGEDEPCELGLLNGCVKFGKKVTRIQILPGRKLKVDCEDDSFKVDHVICTVSLGVLQKEMDTMFSPPLPPAKVKAIQSLQLGTVDKIFFEYETHPFPKNFVGFYPLWLEKDLKELRESKHAWLEGITGIHNITCQPRVVLAWVGGVHGRRAELLTDEEFLESMQWLFRKFLSFEMPEPKRFMRTKWYQNPNFRGSYSYRTTTADELDTGAWDLASPIMGEDNHPSLLFAGEATSRAHYSTVHGATEAGWREADRLIEYYAICN
ncbi:hypothetical protein KR074_004351, partial [Drosophila pseudoananassae]